MKYIVYKTTCLVNSKIYIGYHQTSNPEVFDGYLGCGLYKQHNEYIKHPKTAFHHAVVKYGVDNFKRETLYVFDTSAEALAKEAELVTAEFVRSSNNYNSSLGGEQPINPGKKIYRVPKNAEGNAYSEQFVLYFIKQLFRIIRTEYYAYYKQRCILCYVLNNVLRIKRRADLEERKHSCKVDSKLSKITYCKYSPAYKNINNHVSM